MQATNWCIILLDTVVSKDYGPGALGSIPTHGKSCHMAVAPILSATSATLQWRGELWL